MNNYAPEQFGLIDIENALFTRIAIAVRLQFPEAYVSGEYVAQPPRLPAVYIVEQDNSVYLPGRDSGDIENFANVAYQVDVWSNRTVGKKTESKAIMAIVDTEFAKLGFTRTFLNPVQNLNDPNIFRMTGLYRAVVSKDHYIYRS